MSKRQFQKIFRSSEVEQMRADLRSGNSLNGYFNDAYPVKQKELLQSTIEIFGKAPALKVPKKNPVSADLENALALYEYYKNLDETQASDPRLWTYLGHVEFRKYSLARWGLDEKFKTVKDRGEIQKAVNQVLDHWFVNGNDRDLRRHAIARLWWAAKLTYAPWETDPEFFGDLKKEKGKDPYYFTRVLLSTQDVYQQVLERAMGRSSRILISVLEFLDKNKEFASSRENIRRLMIELNLVYGTKKIIALDRASLSSLIRETASEVTAGK